MRTPHGQMEASLASLISFHMISCHSTQRISAAFWSAGIDLIVGDSRKKAKYESREAGVCVGLQCVLIPLQNPNLVQRTAIAHRSLMQVLLMYARLSILSQSKSSGRVLCRTGRLPWS